MAQVFVVTSGEYSDYSIDAVFSTRELAELYVAQCSGRRPYSDDARIEEYNLDPAEAELREGFTTWFVRLKLDGGDLLEAYRTDGLPDGSEVPGKDIHGNVYTTVLARDRDHAIKVAGERRTRLIARDRTT